MEEESKVKSGDCRRLRGNIGGVGRVTSYEPNDSSLCAQGILLINTILKRANL